MDLKQRIHGCILGGAVGDALGSPLEFLSRSQIRHTFGGIVRDYVEFGDGTGAITDDTQMTLFTAEGVLRARTRFLGRGICHLPSVVLRAYLRWLKTQHGRIPDWMQANDLESGRLIQETGLFSWRAPGNTCLSALEHASPTRLRAANDSKGCGTVMRLAPVGLLFDPLPAFKVGMELSELTHGHPTGILSGGAFAMLIALLTGGISLDDALSEVLARLKQEQHAGETIQALGKARALFVAETIPEAAITALGKGWVAEEALAIAVYCALKFPDDFESAVVAAVNIDGDSDSTGAITGNILGCKLGLDAIPDRWRDNLREKTIVDTIATDICTAKHIEDLWDNPSASFDQKGWRQKYPGC